MTIFDHVAASNAGISARLPDKMVGYYCPGLRSAPRHG